MSGRYLLHRHHHQPRSPLISPDNIKILPEESIAPHDDCSYSVMTTYETDSSTNCSLHSSNIDERKTSNTDESLKGPSSVTVAYGPITVRVRQIQPPTLATGRRSKFLKLEGDAAIKRELRRKKNRDAAKKLKEKRIIIEQQLENDIHDLETKEKELETRVKNLEAYKGQLESRYNNILVMQERLVKTASSTLKQIERNRQQQPPPPHQNVSIYSNGSSIVKEEPRAPSPQWQLFFSI